ncbi:MAG: UDP-N-acetylmuramoyl-L-alanine--D-glutamate ligase [Pseudomonadota bacterium]
MITARAFDQKRYAVLGLARSGKAVVEALVASGAHVLAWDNREAARDGLPEEVELDDPLVVDLTGYDGIVVSPGVPINRHPIADRARAFDLPLIGDIELFAMARSELPEHKVVGITGTNGKSTTTALVHHMLKGMGYSSLMGGNIGLPIMSQMPLQPNAQGPGVYVLELSSFQIDLTYSLACNVVVLLNITPDHLDRYADYPAYAAAKARLFTMQKAGQAAVVNRETEKEFTVLGSRDDLNVQFLDEVAVTGQAEWPALAGPHNRENAAAALGVAAGLGLDPAEAANSFASFGGLSHRMEVITQHQGVAYVNDSKATNPAATAPALAAYRNIHWIAGGLAKQKGLDECTPYFDRIKHAYTIGEAGPDYAELLGAHMPVSKSEMLCTAVRDAFQTAVPGDVVLLSPACASFDQFRDFEARGDCFRDMVEKLIADEGGGL